jgi:hypothetical protein
MPRTWSNPLCRIATTGTIRRLNRWYRCNEEHRMPDPEHPERVDDTDRAPLGPETEADVHVRTTHDVDPDDMFDPLGT